MKRIVLIMFFIISTVLAGCSTTIDGNRALSNKEWIEDIEYLDKELREKHPDIFKYITEETWNENIDKLKSDVSKLSDIDISLRIAQTVALINDAHTYTKPIDLLAPIGQEEIVVEDIVKFPIKFEYFEDGLRVIECDREYEDILGYKLLSINNVATDEVIKKLSTLVSHDYGNDKWAKEKSKDYMSTYEYLKFLDIVDANEIEYLFENHKKEKITVSVNTLIEKEINYISLDTKEPKTNQMPEGEHEFYWFNNFKEDNILYFRFNQCITNTEANMDKENEHKYPNYDDFDKRFVSEMKKGDFDKLVIDLRHNTGGSPRVVESVIVSVKHKTNLRDEDMVVITGKGTFSAATIVAWRLKNELGATVIGEETGGNLNLFGTEGEIITLPNSKVPIRKSWSFMNNKEGYIGGVKPDIEVKQSYENYINGIDDCYEYVKKLK